MPNDDQEKLEAIFFAYIEEVKVEIAKAAKLGAEEGSHVPDAFLKHQVQGLYDRLAVAMPKQGASGLGLWLSINYAELCHAGEVEAAQLWLRMRFLLDEVEAAEATKH